MKYKSKYHHLPPLRKRSRVKRHFDLVRSFSWLVILAGLVAFWWWVITELIEIYHRWVLFDPVP